ncbi:MAG: mechanosensitive ion channel family protein [Firmicutes bacterium]|nr:mechanosensitive ion channel family protein [Bacillota bacterium]
MGVRLLADLFAVPLAGQPLGRWLLALVLTVAVDVALVLVRDWGARLLEAWARRGGGALGDFLARGLLRRTSRLALLVVAVGAGSLVVSLPPRTEALVRAAVLVVVWLQVGIWASRTVRWWLPRWLGGQGGEAELEPEIASVYSILSVGALTLLWALIALLVIGSLGVNVTALVTGLGIGGVAVALALQNILGDLFASVSIVLDKPFLVGDFIVTQDFLGTVERIGVKTTRLRSLSGELLVIPNGDLVRARIRNYRDMPERRVLFTFGVPYGTPREKLEAIPGWVREIVEGIGHTRFDRAHFARYAESWLEFETVYYVLSGDYKLYMDAQQAINLALYRRFEEEGVTFAFPTRTVVLEGGAAARDR